MAEIKIKTGGNSTLVGTMIPVGSRGEPDSIKGISHFLEHMLFKGTTKRTKDDLKFDMEKYGAQFNAWTSEEHTFYYALISNKYADVAREIISDMVNNSVFPIHELEKEKQVVFQELEMYRDNPQSHIYSLAQQEVYKEGSGLHIPIIGTREAVSGITRDTLVEHYEKYYQAKINLDIGGIPCEARNRVYAKPGFSQESLDYSHNDYIVKRKGVNQANMVVTGLIQLNEIKEYFTLELFSAIMNGFSGRFFDVIREQNNLVYHTGFYHQVHSCGTVQYWGYAGLMPSKINLATSLMREQLTKPITEEEMDFARRKWIGEHELNLDMKSTIAKLLIDSTLAEQDYDMYIKNYERNIQNVTLADLNNLAEKANFETSKLVVIIPEK